MAVEHTTRQVVNPVRFDWRSLNAHDDPRDLLDHLNKMYAFPGGLIVRRHYGRFISLVKTRPRAEQDLLLRDAKFTFGVTLGSMREDLKRA